MNLTHVQEELHRIADAAGTSSWTHSLVSIICNPNRYFDSWSRIWISGFTWATCLEGDDHPFRILLDETRDGLTRLARAGQNLSLEED